MTLFIARAKADIPFIQMIMDEQKAIGYTLSINTLLILSILYSERKLSGKELSDKTHISIQRIKPLIETLIERGLVEEIGRGTHRMLMLSKKTYQKAGKTKEYTRQKGIDQVRFSEMILQLAQSQNGMITKMDVVELLHITKAQAYAILQQLCETHQLELNGKGRYARYKLVKK